MCCSHLEDRIHIHIYLNEYYKAEQCLSECANLRKYWYELKNSGKLGYISSRYDQKMMKKMLQNGAKIFRLGLLSALR